LDEDMRKIIAVWLVRRLFLFQKKKKLWEKEKHTTIHSNSFLSLKTVREVNKICEELHYKRIDIRTPEEVLP
jgi:hypothetical protein